jgi:hypothetical protein
MDTSSFVIKWIMVVNGFAELITILTFAGGLGAIYMSFYMLTKLSQQGSMQSMVTYTPKSAMIMFFVGGFAMYLGSYVEMLDASLFAGVNAVSGGDPLSWRADDTVSVSGGPEQLLMALIKKVIQVFGLIGVVNALREMGKLSKPQSSGGENGGVGKVFAFAFGGIALMKIDKTVVLLAELIPYFDGLVKAFNI